MMQEENWLSVDEEDRGRSAQFAYLDLLATTLTEHEKNLDRLIRRLEEISKSLSKMIELAEPEGPAEEKELLRKEMMQDTLVYMKLKTNRPMEELKLVLDTLKE